MTSQTGCNYFGSVCQSTCQFIANSCYSLASEMKTPSRLQGYTLIVGGSSLAILGIQHGVLSLKAICGHVCKRDENDYVLYSDYPRRSNLLTKSLVSITCIGLGSAAIVAGTINLLMPEALKSGCINLQAECLQSHPSCQLVCENSSDYAKDAAKDLVEEGAYRAICKFLPDLDPCKSGVP